MPRLLGSNVMLLAASTLLSVAASYIFWINFSPPSTDGELLTAHTETDPDLGAFHLSLLTTDGQYASEQRGDFRLLLDPFLIYKNYPNQKTAAW